MNMSPSHHVNDGKEDEAQVGLAISHARCVQRRAQEQRRNHRGHHADLCSTHERLINPHLDHR